MKKEKQIRMYFLDDVEKVFEDDCLPYSWFPTQQGMIQGKSGLFIPRKGMLTVFEAAYLDRELADRIRTVLAYEHQITY